MGKPSHFQCGMSKVGRIPTLALSGMIWNDIVNIGRIWYEMGIPYYTYIRLFIYMNLKQTHSPNHWTIKC